jgi:hypothetical protein
MSYESDFYAWVNEQTAQLRAGQLTTLDVEHIAEELEDLGKGIKRELMSRLTTLLAHLLKWEFQPSKRSTSWEVTIDNQRLDLNDLLDENPSLKSQLEEVIAKAYKRAVGEARKQTLLDKSVFPAYCPYTERQILDQDFWPNQ